MGGGGSLSREHPGGSLQALSRSFKRPSSIPGFILAKNSGKDTTEPLKCTSSLHFLQMLSSIKLGLNRYKTNWFKKIKITVAEAASCKDLALPERRVVPTTEYLSLEKTLPGPEMPPRIQEDENLSSAASNGDPAACRCFLSGEAPFRETKVTPFKDRRPLCQSNNSCGAFFWTSSSPRHLPRGGWQQLLNSSLPKPGPQ